ncbi:flagellar export chaperone FliS [Ferrimonas sediminicola]|uniref:Flagellar secretion chaperone FliS n=1 Tax=Ferrimonas sediminicola TaxID=2569538 RepID=A0A4U1BCN9_9GAMM|nr:flagellar export chaperone FliS [Ferrimonas sediminicola]TKB47805.1 flagellar export chaperone FliS [Ferrimonas sediminicola]
MLQEQDPFNAYKQTSLDARAAAANQHEMVRMLLDGLLEELSRAEGHIEARQIEKKGNAIQRCINIVQGLDSMLDLENGGEIALNLHQLYDFCSRELMKASIRNEAAVLGPVVKVVGEIREGWENLN